jgi:uncharacterized protein (TIGR02145 family)
MKLMKIEKTIIYLVIVMSFVACDKNNDGTSGNGNNNGNGSDKSVLINGVRWATCNVGAEGAFVANPEAYGNYYAWTEAKDICPSGWRLPTILEIESLIDTTYVTSEWTILNDIEGMRFTDKNSGNNIFLPAAGFYNHNPGYGMVGVGEFGVYWSSTEYGSGTAYDLLFISKGAYIANSGYSYGMFVRCVFND